MILQGVAVSDYHGSGGGRPGGKRSPAVPAGAKDWQFDRLGLSGKTQGSALRRVRDPNVGHRPLCVERILSVPRPPRVAKKLAKLNPASAAPSRRLVLPMSPFVRPPDRTTRWASCLAGRHRGITSQKSRDAVVAARVQPGTARPTGRTCDRILPDRPTRPPAVGQRGVATKVFGSRLVHACSSKEGRRGTELVPTMGRTSGWRRQLREAQTPRFGASLPLFTVKNRRASRQPGMRETVPGEPFCRLRGVQERSSAVSRR